MATLEAAITPTSWRRTFFTVWTGQAFSLLGSSLVQFALVWWLTQRTGSATVLATATLVAVLPQVFLAPFAGALVDRWNRRLVMMGADTFIALMTAGLAFLYLRGSMQVWHVYAIMFLRALGGAFHWPAMQAATTLMVPNEQLSRIAGLNQTLNGAMNIVAPPVGALLLSILPLHGIMAIDVSTALIAVSLLALVRIPEPERKGAAAPGVGPAVLLRDVREGLVYVWRWPGVFALLLLAAVINLMLTPAFSLMPILVTRHFGGGALQLGWMDSGWGIGVVLGGLVLGVWGGFRRRIVTSITGLVAMGLGIIGVGLVPSGVFWLAVAAVFVAGFMNPLVNGPIMAILQAAVVPEMQGRVFSVVSAVAGLASPLGLAVAGPVADALGVRSWFILGGAVCCLMAFIAFAVPAIMHIEDRSGAKLESAV